MFMDESVDVIDNRAMDNQFFYLLQVMVLCSSISLYFSAVEFLTALLLISSNKNNAHFKVIYSQ